MKWTVMAVALSMFTAASSAQAAPVCVNNLISGLVRSSSCQQATKRNVKLVIIKEDNSWVSYSQGSAVKNGAGDAEALNLAQLFSDRFAGSQPFNVANADRHHLTVRASDGRIIVTNPTWGFTTSVASSCLGNIITGSDGTSRFLISYGPVSPAC